MMNFKLIGIGIVATAALLATPFAASAADIHMPVKGYRTTVAYSNWTGFYAGLNAGYVWGTSNWDFPATTVKPKGYLLGGTVGYNYQMGSIVWGLEGDAAWARVNGSTICLDPLSCETQLRWLATARGRIGYAFDRWLPYVTGGLAAGDVKASFIPLGMTASKTLIG
jgi:outer membrane immunogenic protein